MKSGKLQPDSSIWHNGLAMFKRTRDNLHIMAILEKNLFYIPLIKKFKFLFIAFIIFLIVFSMPVFAFAQTGTVKTADLVWKSYIGGVVTDVGISGDGKSVAVGLQGFNDIFLYDQGGNLQWKSNVLGGAFLYWICREYGEGFNAQS
jgi:hypothetical protein